MGDGGGEEELWHVCSGGRSVTHVPSGGWERRGAMYAVADALTHVPSACMGEKKRSSGMYAVGDAQ